MPFPVSPARHNLFTWSVLFIRKMHHDLSRKSRPGHTGSTHGGFVTGPGHDTGTYAGDGVKSWRRPRHFVSANAKCGNGEERYMKMPGPPSRGVPVQPLRPWTPPPTKTGQNNGHFAAVTSVDWPRSSRRQTWRTASVKGSGTPTPPEA